jgi:D-inositol-3-phosphate glycosyltransferase
MNVYVKELAKQLGRMGIQVDVFTRSQDEHVPHVVHDLGFGNRVFHIPAGPESPAAKQQLAEYIPAFSEAVIKLVEGKGIEYDLIHSHYWMSGIAGIALKEVWGIPMVHMFHTLGLMKNRIARQGEYEGDYRIRGERQVLRNTDKVIAATVAELAQLQWLYEAKTDNVRVVPPGVDLGKFYPIPDDDAREYLSVPICQRMLLFVGRIEPLKGVDTLIRALAVMRDQGSLKKHEVCLSIIGGDASVSEEEMSHEMSRLLDLREELGLEQVITFLGKRAQDTLPYYYSAADVVVVPSHYESFGMVALEAMACGTPVVASQIGGLAYLIQDGETGFHVRDQDPEALAARLMEILDDHQLHQQMGRNAVAYAKSYSWRAVADQVQEVYQEMLPENKTPLEKKNSVGI